MKTFVKRTRRPPKDAVNAMLSFGYTLLSSDMESAVLRVGLDPYIGSRRLRSEFPIGLAANHGGFEQRDGGVSGMQIRRIMRTLGYSCAVFLASPDAETGISPTPHL